MSARLDESQLAAALHTLRAERGQTRGDGQPHQDEGAIGTAPPVKDLCGLVCAESFLRTCPGCSRLHAVRGGSGPPGGAPPLHSPAWEIAAQIATGRDVVVQVGTRDKDLPYTADIVEAVVTLLRAAPKATDAAPPCALMLSNRAGQLTAWAEQATLCANNAIRVLAESTEAGGTGAAVMLGSPTWLGEQTANAVAAVRIIVIDASIEDTFAQLGAVIALAHATRSQVVVLDPKSLLVSASSAASLKDLLATPSVFRTVGGTLTGGEFTKGGGWAGYGSLQARIDMTRSGLTLTASNTLECGSEAEVHFLQPVIVTQISIDMDGGPAYAMLFGGEDFTIEAASLGSEGKTGTSRTRLLLTRLATPKLRLSLGSLKGQPRSQIVIHGVVASALNHDASDDSQVTLAGRYGQALLCAPTTEIEATTEPLFAQSLKLMYVPAHVLAKAATEPIQGMDGLEDLVAGVRQGSPAITHLPWATVDNPGGNSPGNERAENLADESTNTKWFSFVWNGVLEFTFASPVVVISYELRTANDRPQRDPINWTIEAKADADAAWERMAGPDIALSSRQLGRHEWYPEFKLSNCKPITALRLSVTQIRRNDGVQLGHIKFHGYLASKSLNLEVPVTSASPLVAQSLQVLRSCRASEQVAGPVLRYLAAFPLSREDGRTLFADLDLLLELSREHFALTSRLFWIICLTAGQRDKCLDALLTIPWDEPAKEGQGQGFQEVLATFMLVSRSPQGLLQVASGQPEPLSSLGRDHRPALVALAHLQATMRGDVVTTSVSEARDAFLEAFRALANVTDAPDSKKSATNQPSTKGAAAGGFKWATTTSDTPSSTATWPASNGGLFASSGTKPNGFASGGSSAGFTPGTSSFGQGAKVEAKPSLFGAPAGSAATAQSTTLTLPSTPRSAFLSQGTLAHDAASNGGGAVGPVLGGEQAHPKPEQMMMKPGVLLTWWCFHAVLHAIDEARLERTWTLSEPSQLACRLLEDGCGKLWSSTRHAMNARASTGFTLLWRAKLKDASKCSLLEVLDHAESLVEGEARLAKQITWSSEFRDSLVETARSHGTKTIRRRVLREGLVPQLSAYISQTLRDEQFCLTERAAELRKPATSLLRVCNDKETLRKFSEIWGSEVTRRFEDVLTAHHDSARSLFNSIRQMYAHMRRLSEVELFPGSDTMLDAVNDALSLSMQRLSEERAMEVSEVMAMLFEDFLDASRELELNFRVLPLPANGTRTWHHGPVARQRERVLKETCQLLKHMHCGKHFVFFYERRLAYRLLQARSVSMVLEGEVLHMLSRHAGIHWQTASTKIVEVQAGRALTNRWRGALLRAHGEALLDGLDTDADGTEGAASAPAETFGWASVTVCSRWAWPMTIGPVFELPAPLREAQASFTRYYEESNARRRLVWAPSLGSCTLACAPSRDAPGTAPPFQATMRPLHARILLLFNSADRLSKADILRHFPKADSGLGSAIKGALQALVFSGLLAASGDKRRGRVYSPAEPGQLGEARVLFVHDLKAEGHSEDRLNVAWRLSLLDAAVVRQLKSQGTRALTHNELVRLVREQLVSRFIADPARISDRIVELVHQGLIEEATPLGRATISLGLRTFKYALTETESSTISLFDRLLHLAGETASPSQQLTRDILARALIASTLAAGLEGAEGTPSARTPASLFLALRLGVRQRLTAVLQMHGIAVDGHVYKELFAELLFPEPALAQFKDLAPFGRPGAPLPALDSDAPGPPSDSTLSQCLAALGIVDVRAGDVVLPEEDMACLSKGLLGLACQAGKRPVKGTTPTLSAKDFIRCSTAAGGEPQELSQLLERLEAPEAQLSAPPGPSLGEKFVDTLWRSLSREDSIPSPPSSRRQLLRSTSVDPEARDPTILPAAGSSTGTSDVLRDEMNALISTISTTLGLSAPYATVLLLQYQWQPRPAIEGWVTRETDAAFGLLAATAAPKTPKAAAAARAGEPQFECPLCCDSVPWDQVYWLACQHEYCRECWARYIATKTESGEVLWIQCPETSCRTCLSRSELEAVGPESLAAYDAELLRCYIDASPNLVWCKNPRSCDGIVFVSAGADVAVCSKCSYRFCPQCEYPAHPPAACNMIREWEEMGGYVVRNSEDVKSWNLILETTQRCPKCKTPIEKNGGCNHMTCRKANCGYEFCWVCRGPNGRCWCHGRNRGEAHNREENIKRMTRRCAANALGAETARALAQKAASAKMELVTSREHTRLSALEECCLTLEDSRRTVLNGCIALFFLEAETQKAQIDNGGAGSSSKTKQREAMRDLLAFALSDLEIQTDAVQGTLEQESKSLDWTGSPSIMRDVRTIQRKNKSFLVAFSPSSSDQTGPCTLKSDTDSLAFLAKAIKFEVDV